MGQPIVHFEITGKDPEALRGWFGELFGWTFDPPTRVADDISDPDAYGVVTPDGGIPGGIGGGPGFTPQTIFYVAVDDVGSGFASFRHVTRVNPDILKLDRTLVCGIDDDPVRQSLAAAIVSFARDIRATVVSEGIESESELCCLKGLAVGCGQGFHLARPSLEAIEAEVPHLIAVA